MNGPAVCRFCRCGHCPTLPAWPGPALWFLNGMPQWPFQASWLLAAASPFSPRSFLRCPLRSDTGCPAVTAGANGTPPGVRTRLPVRLAALVCLWCDRALVRVAWRGARRIHGLTNRLKLVGQIFESVGLPGRLCQTCSGGRAAEPLVARGSQGPADRLENRPLVPGPSVPCLATELTGASLMGVPRLALQPQTNGSSGALP